jgi:hypothetical protein
VRFAGKCPFLSCSLCSHALELEVLPFIRFLSALFISLEPLESLNFICWFAFGKI